MAYIKGFTTAGTIVKDLATLLTTGDTLNPTNNWELVYPTDLASVDRIATLKVKPLTTKQWVKKELKTVTSGKITLTDGLAQDATTRVFVRDKKYYLYLKEDEGALDIMEYRIFNGTTLEVNAALNGKQVLVSYEKAVNIESEYFVRIERPLKTSANKDNYFYIEWKIGDGYDAVLDTFSANHVSNTGKVNWFRETPNASLIAQDWLPIEYWLSFDRNAATGVLMGDPGLSVSDWLSSPFYFGSLEQIDGALETDLKGNFAGFGGSYTEPVLTKQYGDYTGNGMTDVILASTKTGRPYQAHKVSIFGGYEFKEKTFNGQSAHTGKHPVSDIVLTDVHENDRGTLRHCLAVPRVAKSHATELIYNRYISGKEETYIFLNITAPYTPFNTSSDSLIGFAIRTDI